MLENFLFVYSYVLLLLYELCSETHAKWESNNIILNKWLPIYGCVCFSLIQKGFGSQVKNHLIAFIDSYYII